MSSAIRVEELSKRYQLGVTHAGSVREAANLLTRRLLQRQQSTAPAQMVDADAERVDGKYFWALQDASFQIERGEAVGIIGKNGAGKSTLLKLLSRITRPTSGRAELRGRLASLLEVGTGFHPELTGRENVYLNGTILGMTRREITTRFDDIVDFAGVTKFIDTPVKRYSSGMMVRLGFAVAAHLNPEILIVDEVLAVGDTEFQKRCLGKMQNVAASGTTVLFVSHNLASIRALTPRTLVLSRGRLIHDGGTPEGIARYNDENLLGANCPSSVERLPRPFKGLDRAVEFIRLRIKSEDGRGTILSGQPLTFDATIRANQPAGNIILSLTILTDDKTPVGSSFSHPLPPPGLSDTQSYRFVGTFPLAPGRYHCAVSLTSETARINQLYDSLTDVLPFEIAPAALPARSWTATWGIIQFPAIQGTKLDECADLASESATEPSNAR